MALTGLRWLDSVDVAESKTNKSVRLILNEYRGHLVGEFYNLLRDLNPELVSKNDCLWDCLTGCDNTYSCSTLISKLADVLTNEFGVTYNFHNISSADTTSSRSISVRDVPGASGSRLVTRTL